MCHATERSGTLDVRFLDSATQQALARIIIPIDEALETFWKGSEDFYNTIKSWLTERKIPVIPVRQEDPAPGSIVPFPAQIFRLGRLSMEAEIECYYLSIGAASRAKVAKKSGPIELVPVARVCLPVPVLAGLLDFMGSKRGSSN